MPETNDYPKEPRRTKRSLGWITLGVFLLTYIFTWIADAAWGLGATQIGRQLGFSAPLITAFSLGGITFIQFTAWALTIRWVLKCRLSDIAFPFHRGWWIDLLVGIAVTSAVIALLFLLSVEAGWLVVNGWVWNSLPLGRLLGAVWTSLLINASVAVLEELSSRAYLLTGLKEAWGRWLGLVVMSAVFGAVHLLAYLSSGYPFFALALPVVAAFLFGWIYLQTGSLWLPVGIHFAYDLMEMDILNLSGDMSNARLFGAMTEVRGPLPIPSFGNAILLDSMILVLVFLGSWVWLRYGAPRRSQE